jgi:hypothetical protein
MLGTLAQQSSNLDELDAHLNAFLARLRPQGLGSRGRRAAMELLALPYHGTVGAAHQNEVHRSKAKGDTPYFFTYATTFAVVCGRRYTLAMCGMRAKQPMDRVVCTLLERLVTLGIRLILLLLDQGFPTVRVRRTLLTARLPCLMPAVTRRKTPTTPGGPTGTYAQAAEEQSRWIASPLRSAQEDQVDFELAVGCHNTRGQRRGHQRQGLLYTRAKVFGIIFNY